MPKIDFTTSGGGKIDTEQAGMLNPIELVEGIAESAPGQHAATALERAIDAVTSADNIGEGILGGASELYAGGLNLTSDLAQALGMNMENVPEYTGESATAFWRGLAGDEAARQTPVTTRKGEETTLGEVKGYEQMAEDVKTGVEGLGKAAQLGALTEIWSNVASSASKPITSTANTLEQLMSIDNRRSI